MLSLFALSCCACVLSGFVEGLCFSQLVCEHGSSSIGMIFNWQIRFVFRQGHLVRNGWYQYLPSCGRVVCSVALTIPLKGHTVHGPALIGAVTH